MENMKNNKNKIFGHNEVIYIGKDKTEYKMNSIIQGDTLEVLKGLPDNCIDTIFADPPYFMQSTEKVLFRADGTGEFKGCDDEWDKYSDYIEYDNFCNNWLKECYRILKTDGTIWVIGSFQNIYRIGYMMQNIGFWILNDIIWNKSNPTPNMSGSRFCNAHETMLWCSKSKKSSFCFNYKTMKYLNNNVQDRSVWTLNICQGKERLKDEEGKKLHTTQKPECLLKKVILSSTKPGYLVLDPFFGTGTTGAVCKKYGRNYIGIEREEKYIEGAKKRIDNVKDESDDISNLKLETKPPKVSLTKLMELHLLSEGETLYDKNGKEICILLDNGKVKDEEETLSIHKMSAKVLGKANHNGWNYFYAKRSEELISIDSLRYKASEIGKEENIEQQKTEYRNL